MCHKSEKPHFAHFMSESWKSQDVLPILNCNFSNADTTLSIAA